MSTCASGGLGAGTSLLRPITAEDQPAVLALNAANVELLAPMDEARLRQLRALADHADVIEHDGRFAGFVLTFAPDTAYDSENYAWFGERYDDFYYLDRIVLDPSVRRLGLGRAVYDEIERHAAPHGRMALEVNIEPPNAPSLAFHRGRGFRAVGRQSAGDHEVALMVKELQSLATGATDIGSGR